MWSNKNIILLPYRYTMFSVFAKLYWITGKNLIKVFVTAGKESHYNW